ncbi:MAG: hypothetical protein HY255_05650 [Betaproteobacteria bacterium]|nr:hypothetical protein [Betaproteobacteria bacterium]
MAEIIRKIVGGRSPKRCASSLPTVEHAEALIRYTSERGIQPPALQTLCDLLDKQRSPEDSARSLQMPLNSSSVVAYADLSKSVAPITGASIVDSENVDKIVRPLLFWTLAFVFLALYIGALSAWVDVHPNEEDNPGINWLYQLQVWLEYPAPFLWGALGSCVYLLKRYTDLAEARQFDEDSLQGWGTRIILGAILGGIIQYIYDSKTFTNAGINLNANALGFLCGIGRRALRANPR